MEKQTYKNWQLCIVDDGSTDSTALIASTYKDSRICLKQIEHAGCPTARNHCLEMAEGEIIARLDADDTHEPERLERQVSSLLKNHDIDIVTCEMTWLKGRIKMAKKVGGMDPRTYMSGKSNGPVCASIVTWKATYDRVGDFKPHQLAGSDGDWNFRAIVAGVKWFHFSNHWYNQRRHKDQLSNTSRIMQQRVHREAREKYCKIWKTGL